jgi:biotin transporter BioY
MIIGALILGWLLCGYLACMISKRISYMDISLVHLILSFILGPLAIMVSGYFWVEDKSDEVILDRWIL